MGNGDINNDINYNSTTKQAVSRHHAVNLSCLSFQVSSNIWVI